MLLRAFGLVAIFLLSNSVLASLVEYEFHGEVVHLQDSLAGLHEVGDSISGRFFVDESSRDIDPARDLSRWDSQSMSFSIGGGEEIAFDSGSTAIADNEWFLTSFGVPVSSLGGPNPVLSDESVVSARILLTWDFGSIDSLDFLTLPESLPPSSVFEDLSSLTYFLPTGAPGELYFDITSVSQVAVPSPGSIGLFGIMILCFVASRKRHS